MTFARAYSLAIVAPIAVLLLAAILTGPWWTVLMLAVDLAIALWFWRLFSRPDWPGRA